MAAKGFTPVDAAVLSERRVGIGMLGYGFMGKVHSNAFLKIPYSFNAPAAYPQLVAICGRDEAKVANMAARMHYGGYYTDWKLMLKDPAIDVVDNVHARRPAPGAVHCRGPGRQARHLREAAGDDGARCGRDAGGRGKGGREAHVLLQLPLLPRSPAREGTDRNRGAGQSLSLPRPLSAGAGP